MSCGAELNRGYSSAGRALEWHSRGQRFDPAYLHQEKGQGFYPWPVCFMRKVPRTADLLRFNHGQRKPLRPAAKRLGPSAVRSRLSPPRKRPRILSLAFCFMRKVPRTADLLLFNHGQRKPLRPAAKRLGPSAVRSRLSPPTTDRKANALRFCSIYGSDAPPRFPQQLKQVHNWHPFSIRRWTLFCFERSERQVNQSRF